ncbi:hypothetical protein C8R45DRAFT_934152 [Mycena sanguinolenta]|nr:hypothetical protein C8R45DRAFT_934152 [Mycena sanguinolenta]
MDEDAGVDGRVQTRVERKRRTANRTQIRSGCSGANLEWSPLGPYHRSPERGDTQCFVFLAANKEFTSERMETENQKVVHEGVERATRHGGTGRREPIGGSRLGGDPIISELSSSPTTMVATFVSCGFTSAKMLAATSCPVKTRILGFASARIRNLSTNLFRLLHCYTAIYLERLRAGHSFSLTTPPSFHSSRHETHRSSKWDDTYDAVSLTRAIVHQKAAFQKASSMLHIELARWRTTPWTLQSSVGKVRFGKSVRTRTELN